MYFMHKDPQNILFQHPSFFFVFKQNSTLATKLTLNLSADSASSSHLTIPLTCFKIFDALYILTVINIDCK